MQIYIRNDTKYDGGGGLVSSAAGVVWGWGLFGEFSVIPLIERIDLTEKLQEIVGICIDTQIIKAKT